MTYYLRSGGNRWDIKSKRELSTTEILEEWAHRIKKRPPKALGLLIQLTGGGREESFVQTESALKRAKMWGV